MRMGRNVTVLAIAAAGGAALGLAQVGVAELTGITTLGGDFGGGNDRVQGVQVTLIAWYCAMAVPLATWMANARRAPDTTVRLGAVLAGALGTLAAYPLVGSLSDVFIRGLMQSAVLSGVVLGVVAGVAVALLAPLGRGLAAYGGLLWVLALVCALLVDPTVVYAGMVEPLGLEFLNHLRSVTPSLPSTIGYHLPAMLPVAVAVLILTGVLAGRATRRGDGWGRSLAPAVAGPVLAVATYRVTSGQSYLWNEAAGTVVTALAACCVVVAAVCCLAVAAVRRRSAVA